MFWLLNSLFRLSETFKLKIRAVSSQFTMAVKSLELLINELRVSNALHGNFCLYYIAIQALYKITTPDGQIC